MRATATVTLMDPTCCDELKAMSSQGTVVGPMCVRTSYLNSVTRAHSSNFIVSAKSYLVWALTGVFVIAACSESREASPTSASGSKGATIASSVIHPPAPDGLPARASLRQTSQPDRAVANLDRRIENLYARLKKRPEQISVFPKLIPALLDRVMFLGTFDDYDRAFQAAQAYLRVRPRDAEAHLLHARVNAAVHRFDAAQADIARAHELGAHPSAYRDLQASVWQAVGKFDRARALHERGVEVNPTIRSLGLYAVFLAEIGDFERAENMFQKALASYRDVSPFPLAWVCFEWGRLYEKVGSPSRARHMHQLAHERLPQFQAAAGHLAGAYVATGETDRAARLLRTLTTESSNPEYRGQLAIIERKLGNIDIADELLQRASREFDQLLARYPQAFGDHAARHFLDAGVRAAQAHELALLNLKHRPIPAAYELAIEAALQADEQFSACAVADAAGDNLDASQRLRFHAWRAYNACGQRERAAVLSKRLGMDGDIAP